MNPKSIGEALEGEEEKVTTTIERDAEGYIQKVTRFMPMKKVEFIITRNAQKKIIQVEKIVTY